MNKKEKIMLIKKIDKLIGEHDNDGIDKVLLEIIENFNQYDKKLIELILGYTGVFRKVLIHWQDLFNKLEKSK